MKLLDDISHRALSTALAVGLAGGLAAVPAQALAQAAPQAATEEGGLEEIVVTAQRREENLQSVPISVSAITAGTLEKSGISATIQLSQVVPAVQITRSGPQTIFFIRGVGNSSANIGEEGANAIYVDGVYLGDLTSVNTDFNNIERIEVLKGPQGTLFGRNSSGGLINIITKEPGSKTEVKASVGYGNYKTKRGQLYVVAPLNDKISADISLTGRDQDKGWGKNLFTGQDYSKGWMYGARLKTVWRPGETTKIVTSVDFKRSFDTFTSGFQIHKDSVVAVTVPGQPTGIFTYFGDYNVNTPQAGSAKIKAWGAAVTVEQEFDWATLTSITGMRYVRVQSRLDPDFSPLEAQFADVQGATRSWQQELRLASAGGGPLNWQVGGFYYDATAKLLGQTVTGLALGGLGRGLRIVSTGKTKSYAGFGEITYDITPSTHVTGGVRYTSEKRSYVGQEYPQNQVPNSALFCAFTVPKNLPPNPPCLPVPIHLSKTFHKVTYRVAVRQDLNDDINVYASYNRGFKSGIYALNATPGAATAPILKPQVIDAFEAGFKSELFDRVVRLNGAYFHYKIKDYQIRTAAPGSIATAILLNAGRVKVDGAEIEMVVAPTRELRITANATYLNSRFGSFLNNASFVPRTTGNVATPCVLSSAPAIGGNFSCFNQNATGNKTPLSPKFAVSLGVNYTMPVGDDGEIIFNALVNRTGKVFFEADNRLSQPAFTIVNGAIEYKPSPNWGIEFYVNNLTDKQYYVVAVGGSTGDHGELGAPRTYGVNVKFDF
jgi:iron complex outermembrane recepter protein